MVTHTILLIGQQNFAGFECWYRLPHIDLSHTSDWRSIPGSDRLTFDVLFVEYDWLVQLTAKAHMEFFAAFQRQPIIVLFDQHEIDRESLIAIGVQAVWSVEELQYIDLQAFLRCAIERQRRLRVLEDERRQMTLLMGKLKTAGVKSLDHASGVTKILDAQWVEQSAKMLKKVRDQNQRLQHLAHHDSLTGLLTRDLFHEMTEAALARAQRNDKHLALLLLDLDNFKQVNDTYGHPIGDLLLQQVVMRMQAAVRDEDIIARMGGDEFAILLPEINNVAAAGLVARKLLSAVSRQIYRLDEYEVTVTVSIGIACYPFAGVQVSELIKHADIAMYRSKRAGKNRYQYFTKQINQQLVRRMTLERDLDRSVANDELSLAFQSVVDVKTQACRQLNAVIFWRNQQYGEISFKEFFALAEQSHMIVELGLWMLERLFEQMHEWSSHTLAKPLRYSMPLSVLHMRDHRFIKKLQTLIAQYPEHAERLVFLLDESSWLHDQTLDVTLLQPLIDLGCGLMLSQFGLHVLDLDALVTLPLQAVLMPASSQMSVSATCAAKKQRILMLVAQAQGWRVIASAESTDSDEALLAQGVDWVYSAVALNAQQIERQWLTCARPAE